MNRELSGWLALLGAVCVAAAVAVLGWQAFQWLRLGAWPELPLTYVLSHALNAGLDSWLFSPQEWRGVHKLLNLISLSGGLAILGALLAWVAVAIE